MPGFTRPTRKQTGTGLAAAGFAALALAAKLSGDIPSEVVTGLSVVGLVLLGLGVLAFRQIEKTGLDGSATITSVATTGRKGLDDLPEVAMDLLVAVPGQPPYAARANTLMAPAGIDRLKPGMSVVVKIDRKDPQAVLIDWKASASTMAALMSPSGEGGPDEISNGRSS
jgi:hypothetical protein